MAATATLVSFLFCPITPWEMSISSPNLTCTSAINIYNDRFRFFRVIIKNQYNGCISGNITFLLIQHFKKKYIYIKCLLYLIYPFRGRPITVVCGRQSPSPVEYWRYLTPNHENNRWNEFLMPKMHAKIGITHNY